MTDVTTLEEITAGLGPDELRVLVLIAERLARGRSQYGKLRIESDSRDWSREAREEALDLCVYSAIHSLSGQRWHTAEALARTQARCGELLEEVRALRREKAVTAVTRDGA